MTEKRKYAEDTNVPVERTQGEISSILRRFGADEFGHKETRENGYFMFVIEGIAYQMTVPLPAPDEFLKTPGGQSRTKIQAEDARGKEIRRRWRALLLNIKGKIVAIDDGITTVQNEFLSFVVLPSGETLGQKLLPVLNTISQTGKMPLLDR